MPLWAPLMPVRGRPSVAARCRKTIAPSRQALGSLLVVLPCSFSRLLTFRASYMPLPPAPAPEDCYVPVVFRPLQVSNTPLRICTRHASIAARPTRLYISASLRRPLFRPTFSVALHLPSTTPACTINVNLRAPHTGFHPPTYRYPPPPCQDNCALVYGAS